MARHRARRKRLRWIAPAGAAIAGVAAAATAVALLGDREPPDQVGAPTDEVTARICTMLKVVTSTSFEPVLTDLAPVLGEGADCVRLDVQVADGEAADQAVAETDADVWIADDGSWANVAKAAELDMEAPGAGTVVATSPIYMVTDPTTADLLNQAGGGWLDLADEAAAGENVRLVVRDPAGWGDGLVAVGAVGEAVWQDAGMDASAEALMTAYPSTLTVPDHAFPVQQGDVGLVPEYALVAMLDEEGEPDPRAAEATLLAGSDYSAVMRYTWLPTARGTGNARHAAAMDRVLAVLTSDQAADSLRKAGLRDANATPLEPAPADFPPVDAPPFDVLGTHRVDHVFATWYTGERRSDVLLVIDVSGSMAEPAPGSDTPLIDLVREGVLGLAELLPDDSRMALWQFGAQLDPPRDYEELLPWAPLDAAHRDALAEATTAMTVTDTGTGLYDTTLAAYQYARDNYREATPNHVIVFTDGRNEDRPGSIGIDELASGLSEATDPARPVQLTIISFGADTDAELLQSALEETGVYVAQISSASEVHPVFIHQAAGGRHGPG